MDAQVIFPSVICQRRVIKLCFVKDNSKHREESMMRNSNRTQMRGRSGRRDLPAHGNESKFSVLTRLLLTEKNKKTKRHTYNVCSVKTFHIKRTLNKIQSVCVCQPPLDCVVWQSSRPKSPQTWCGTLGRVCVQVCLCDILTTTFEFKDMKTSTALHF